ncbi:MAG: hypothetical protein ACJA0K_001067 [Maricaulis maris]
MLHCKPLRFGAAIAQGGAGSKPLAPGVSAYGRNLLRHKSRHGTPAFAHQVSGSPSVRDRLAKIFNVSTRSEKAIAK